MLINELDVYPSTCTLYEEMRFGLYLKLLPWQLLVELAITVPWVYPKQWFYYSAQLLQLLKLLAASDSTNTIE